MVMCLLKSHTRSRFRNVEITQYERQDTSGSLHFANWLTCTVWKTSRSLHFATLRFFSLTLLYTKYKTQVQIYYIQDNYCLTVLTIKYYIMYIIDQS